MKYAVISTSRKTNVIKYADILKNYNLISCEIIDPMDIEEKSLMYYINIDTLEELIKLKKELKKELIICDEFIDRFNNEYNEIAIEIYDSWRE